VIFRRRPAAIGVAKREIVTPIAREFQSERRGFPDDPIPSDPGRRPA
jgi:hypothetical protein